MIKNDFQIVPERYMREHKDRPVIDEPCLASPKIPVVDFSLLANRDEEEQRKLDFACKEWGFFKVSLFKDSVFS